MTTNATTLLDRSNWPKAKTFTVVPNGPMSVDILAQQDSTTEELEAIARDLMTDVIEFGLNGRKPS